MKQIKFCDRSMKKHFILVAVIGVLIAVGCSSPYSENIDEPVREDNKKAKEVIITATFDNQSDAQTKTVLNAEGKVEWLPADEIVIFSDGESAKFTSINTENARKANFRGTISFVTGATEGSDPDAFVYGLYPYDANATAAGGVITTTIPTAQVGLAGSFADDLALAVAKSVSTNLSFKNAYSGIDFEFSEEGYETVTLSSNNGEPIAGAVTISFGSDGVPVTTVDANGSPSITLTAPGGGTFETEKRYYILCAPQTLNGGYTLTAEKSTGRAVFERASKKEFKRNVLTDVSGYLNERATFESLNITFADANVKAICVAPATGWDTNGDGELSYAEAAAVTDIGTVFKNTEITSFDELKYFTGITSLSERVFSDCSLLESLSFPPQITSIGLYAFQGTSSLNRIIVPSIDLWLDLICERFPFTKSPSGGDLYIDDVLITEFNLPSGRTRVPDGMCGGLTKLEAVNIPEGVTSIGKLAFFRCTSLTSIVIPEGITVIKDLAFGGCSSLSSIVLPEGLETIEGGSSYIIDDNNRYYGVFGNCAFSRIDIPSTVTSIGDFAFNKCQNLSSITIHEGLTSIGSLAFSKCGLKYISLPESIQSLCSDGDNKGAFHQSSISSIEGYPSLLSCIRSGFSDGSGRTECYHGIKKIKINGNGSSYGTEVRHFYDFQGLEQVIFSEGLTEISKECFNGCIRLTSILIPESTTIIGESAFGRCSKLTEITIPDNVTSIGKFAFASCQELTGSIFIPAGVVSIGDNPFAATGITSIIVSDSNSVYDSRNQCNAIIETSSNTIITGCPNTVIPETATSIGADAFYGLTDITGISIPSGIASIGTSAFLGCTNLESVWVYSSIPPAGSSSMFPPQVGSTHTKIFVPAASVDIYKAAEYWSDYRICIQAMDEVAVTGVSFDIATLTLDANTSTTLVPIVAPENATDKTVTWTSSNPDAVTVDQSGTITAQNGGSSMITVTTTDGGYSASCVVTVKPNDIHFNPDSYIIYRKNQYMSEQQPNYYTFESHFDPFAAGQKVEFKFQIDSWSSTNSTVPLAGLEYSRFDLIIDNYSCFNYVTNGVNCNDVMTVTIDLTANKMTINGKTSTDVPSLQNEEDRYFFSCYDEYSDSGRYHIWTGTEEETKIYYIVVRDSNNVIIQEGYPDRAVNPETGNTEYCWCWRAADGTKTYNFANAAGTYGAYEGYIP